MLLFYFFGIYIYILWFCYFLLNKSKRRDLKNVLRRQKERNSRKSSQKWFIVCITWKKLSRYSFLHIITTTRFFRAIHRFKKFKLLVYSYYYLLVLFRLGHTPKYQVWCWRNYSSFTVLLLLVARLNRVSICIFVNLKSIN